jgi:Zn-dependent peptidase ImmA (M78 family)
MRFTVGEEFGHLTLHSPLTVSPKEADTQARRFASELLVPHDALARDIDPPITIAGLVRLKPRWKMSLAGLLRATFNCGMIDANQYRYLNYQLSARGWKKQEPGDEGIRAETPQLLLKMAQVAYGDKADRRIREDFGIPLHIIRCLLHSDPTAASRAVIPMQGGRPY